MVAEGLTFKKRLNLVKCGINLGLRLNRNLGLPPGILIESTNACNLRCPLCPSGEGTMSRPRGQMSYETFQRVLDELGEVLVFAVLHVWGEPFLNEELPSMIEACTERNIQTILSTNGHCMHTLEEALEVVDAGLKAMIIAMDGSTQDILGVFRKGSDVEMVKRCAALVEEAKSMRGSRHPYTNLRTIITRHTEGDLPNMERLASELGVNMVSSTRLVPIDATERFDDFVPGGEAPRLFKTEGVERAEGALIKCPFPFRQPTVFWDGTVVGCFYDWNAEASWGNIYEHGFSEIWNSPRALELRRRIRKGPMVGMCHSCIFQNYAFDGSVHSFREFRPLEPPTGGPRRSKLALRA